MLHYGSLRETTGQSALSAVKAALQTQGIETPSWAFGNSGTRFKVFAQQGVPRDPYEKLADAAPGAPVHRASRRRWRCTSRGTRSTTTRDAGRRTPTRAGRRASARSTPTSSRTTTTSSGSVTNPDAAGAPQGDRPPAGVRRHHGRHRVARPEAVVLRRHQLPGPGRHPRPARTGWPRRWPRCTTRLGDDQRMLLEYKLFEPGLLHHRRAGLGHRVRALPRSWASEGAGRGRHRAPRAGHEHRVHRGVRCCGAGSSAGSTSTRASTPTTT